MSDGKELVEEIIERLLASMEGSGSSGEVVTVLMMNYNAMMFNWQKVQPIFQG